MKILIVQLLRLGDVVMITPTIEGLRKKHPEAQIHLLMNESCKSLKPLIKNVDKFHFFDRDGLQASLGDAEASIFQGLERLEVWSRKLNAEKFTQIINLTQNRLSGLLVSQINASKKVGLHFENGVVDFGSPWFKYLNDHNTGREIFHYSDIFQYGADVDHRDRCLTLEETEAGHLEAARILSPQERPVCVQISTSDPKKEWNDQAWLQALTQFHVFDKSIHFRVLGGANESARIEAFVQQLRVQGLRADAAICSLEGAFSILKRARLVVSLDTSIKHMASAAGAPVVELCFGPSDERKTGVYTEDAVILKSKIGSDTLPASMVALVLHHFLRNDWSALRTIAKEYAREALVLRTGFASDFWAALPLDDSNRRWAFETVLNRSAWKLYLENAHKKLVGEYGSEGLRLKSSIPWIFPELDTSARMSEIKKIEDEMNEVDERLRAISTTLKSFARRNNDGTRLAHLSEKIHDWVESNAEEVTSIQMLELSRRVQIGDVPDLRALRDLENHMRGYIDRQDIKLKLIRSIKTNAMETI